MSKWEERGPSMSLFDEEGLYKDAQRQIDEAKRRQQFEQSYGMVSGVVYPDEDFERIKLGVNRQQSTRFFEVNADDKLLYIQALDWENIDSKLEIYYGISKDKVKWMKQIDYEEYSQKKEKAWQKRFQ